MESSVFPWRIFCATAVIALIFFSFTLTSAVLVWSDESFIVEYGRATLGFFAAGMLAAAIIILPFRREFVYGLADAGLLTMLQSQMSRGDGIGEQLQALLLSFEARHHRKVGLSLHHCDLTRRGASTQSARLELRGA